jgi:hypothetical protein
MKRSLWPFSPSHRPIASWAEIGTIGLTAAIVAVGVMQACIYSQQKKIMEAADRKTQQFFRITQGANVTLVAFTEFPEIKNSEFRWVAPRVPAPYP